MARAYGSGRQTVITARISDTLLLASCIQGAYGKAMLPEMLRWLWRDAQPVSTDPNDAAARGFRQAYDEGP